MLFGGTEMLHLKIIEQQMMKSARLFALLLIFSLCLITQAENNQQSRISTSNQ